MKILVDTHLIHWAAATPKKLPKGALTLLRNPDHQLWFSAASLWEVAIKGGLGRPDFQVDTSLLRRGLVDNGWIELPVTGAHAVAVGSLPWIHRDPFDRMLVAQARAEGVMLITVDEQVAAYGSPVRAV